MNPLTREILTIVSRSIAVLVVFAVGLWMFGAWIAEQLKMPVEKVAFCE